MASTQMQRGQSTKHARSKSTSTAQYLMPPSQDHSNNNNNNHHHHHNVGQQQRYVASNAYQQNPISHIDYHHHQHHPSNNNNNISNNNMHQQLYPQQQQQIISNSNSNSNYAMMQQVSEPPKRTLKPKDLNNCNNITPADPLARKCVTPLDKDSRTKPSSQRTSSKDQQRKSTKINSSPEKYYSSHQSRTISHTQEGGQNKPAGKSALQSASSSNTAKHHHQQQQQQGISHVSGVSGAASLRGSHQSKLTISGLTPQHNNPNINGGLSHNNTPSIANAFAYSSSNNNNNSSSKADKSELSGSGVLLLSASSHGPTGVRKPSSMSSKNVPLPKSIALSGTPSSSTNQAINYNSANANSHLNASLNQNYYSNVNGGSSTNTFAKQPAIATRQQRANKSVHNVPSFNVSSSIGSGLPSYGSNTTTTGGAQLIGGVPHPSSAYQFLYQATSQQQQVPLPQPPAHPHPHPHHRSSSNYHAAHHSFQDPLLVDPHQHHLHQQQQQSQFGSVYASTSTGINNPHMSLYNQINNLPHSGTALPGHYTPNMLSLSFNKDEDASFISQHARFPHTSHAHSSHASQPFSLASSSQTPVSLSANLKKKHQLNVSSVQYNQQLFTAAQQQSQQQQQHQLQLQQQQQLANQQSSQVVVIKNERALELLSKGKHCFKENNIEEALRFFSDAMKEEPMMLESQYLLGVCYLSSGLYQKAVEEFCDLLEKNEHYKRNIYLLIAIAYKKTSVINAAIQILGKAIQQYPKYYDAYIYRGKLQVKMKRFDKAISDFDIAIRLNNSCGLGYMGKADCLRFMNEFEKAIGLYTEALQKEEVIAKVAILKRAITYIEAKQFAQAKVDLEHILSDDPCNSEAYYFKGMLYYKQKNINEAILSFEQAIKHNNSRKAVTKALYEISKIKIELRDFYQAYHTLQRAEYLDVDIKSLEKFRIFTDGVTFLMKRKHKEGIKNLTNLVKNFSLGDFLKPLVYTYRSYGYFCVGKHSKACSDLQLVESISKLEKTSQYNKQICEGIISASNGQFEQAMTLFNKALKTCPLRMEPQFYKGMTQIQFANKLIPKTDLAKQLQYRQNALKSLDKAVELNNANSNLYYHRGVLKFALNQVTESINDFNLAIEKAEENQAKHHQARGLAYACCGYISESVQELSYAMQQDPEIMKNPDVLLLRAKCYMIFKELNCALEDMDRIIELNTKLASSVIFDKLCLSSLKTASAAASSTTSDLQTKSFREALLLIKQAKSESANTSGNCFRDSDYHFYKGVYYFYLSEFHRSLKHFNKSLDLKSIQSEKERERKLDDLQNLIDQDSSDLQDPTALSPLHEYEFTNRTYSIYEYYYNSAACYIMLSDFENAYHQLLKLQECLPDVECSKKVEILIQILNDENESNRSISENFDLDLFPVKNRLCSIFPKVIANFAVYPEFTLNLYFCLPSIDVTEMKTTFDDSMLETLLPTAVENKPEAPWIRRTSEGIIFTENVQYFADLDLKTESARGSARDNKDQNSQLDDQEELNSQLSQKISASQFQIDLKGEYVNGGRKPQQGRADAGGEGKSRQKPAFDYEQLMNDHSHYLYQDYKDIDYSCDGEEAVYRYSPKQVDKSKLKDLLKLDDDIEKKLAKIKKKNQES